MKDKTNPEAWKIILRGAFVLGVIALLLSPTPDEAKQLIQEKGITDDQTTLSRYSLQFSSISHGDKPKSAPEPEERLLHEQAKTPNNKTSTVRKPEAKREEMLEAKNGTRSINNETEKTVDTPEKSKPNPAPSGFEMQQVSTKPEKTSRNKEPVEALETQNDSAQTLANDTQEAAPLIKTPLFKTPPTPPPYPVMARRRGQEGVVLLEVWLDEQGRQTQLAIKKSSGNQSLDTSAITSVQKWSFQAHSIDGLSVASRVHIPIRFRLN